MRTHTYADRRSVRRAPPALRQPRNMRAAAQAKAQGLSLVISFAGDAPFDNPTVYCDPGERYDWSFLEGLHATVVVRPGMDVRGALAEILERVDCFKSYPVLVDIERQEIACIVHGGGPRTVDLWPMRRDCDLWQLYFG